MYRWKECPGSVRESKGIESESSSYAKDGVTAHAIAADILLGEGKYTEILFAHFPREDQESDRNEMMLAVHEYVDTVRATIAKSPNAKVLIEHRFDLKDIHPAAFGTSDCTIFIPEEKKLYVFDYKHGAGIAVEVDDNDQLKYYGLGALLSSGFAAETIELGIIQPRCDHRDGPDRRFSFPSVEILDFAADLQMYARATDKPDAPLKSGDHCHFCPAIRKCPLVQAQKKQLMESHFPPVTTTSYDPEKLSQTLDTLDAIEARIKSIREFAYAEASQGRCPPNYKLVQKQARRSWRNAAEMIAEAKKSKREDFLEESLKTPAQIEKIVGKKEFEKAYSTHVIKESSGTTLVHVSDKRQAVEGNGSSKFFQPVTENNASIFD